ncbi:hypothetical protein QW180_08540 [Vibrio sinaloensis]|nr:hypothetical protein [Vibrio sinaloensis]
MISVMMNWRISKKNFGCDIIDLDDIDQYNDFDSVAALMNCLNLVIAPCTSVAELAGAIGTRTLFFFANSEEITWRIDKKMVTTFGSTL